MLIAVVSDTHRQKYYIQKVKSYIQNADILLLKVSQNTKSYFHLQGGLC